jgi:uncharacterized membrane protein
MTDRRHRDPARDQSARNRLLVAVAVGVVGAVVTAMLGGARLALLVGWDLAALTFCGSMWRAMWPMDPGATQAHSQRENPGRDTTDLVLVGAGLASLVAVGLVLVGASNDDASAKFVVAGLAAVSVFVSWTTVHTVFAARYASLYYEGTPGGIDFNQDDEGPDYRDFAYLAFTLGMTFQVSDTDLTTKAVRRTALRQALVSFPLGTVIIASMINLVSGLAK